MVVTMIFSLLFFLLQMNIWTIIIIDHKNILNKFDDDNKTLFNREVHREMTTYYKMVLNVFMIMQ